jgi:hypothetical protein
LFQTRDRRDLQLQLFNILGRRINCCVHTGGSAGGHRNQEHGGRRRSLVQAVSMVSSSHPYKTSPFLFLPIELFRRGKLFLFGETMLDKGTGNKSWKERGVGEIKFLKHKDHGRIRVLMRQDKTMKLIVNHFLDPRIVLTPNSGSDKSWVWVAFDFSDGELVETVRGTPIFIVEFILKLNLPICAFFFL